MPQQTNNQVKYASLNSGLLARKGQARPAMRRPTAAQPHGFDEADDLGWNDFNGSDYNSEIKPNELNKEPVLKAPDKDVQDNGAAPDNVTRLDPEQAQAIIRPVVREMAIKARRRGRSKPKNGSAFTLRMDSDRHLRLRLACVIQNVSAQKLITEALDQMLDSMPEIDPLADQIASE